MKSTYLFGALCLASAAGFAVQPAHAAIHNPSTSRPIVPHDNGFETTLQEVFDDIVTSGSIDAQHDQVTAAIFHTVDSSSFATFVVSIAGLAKSNKFGIYEFGDPDNRVEIFDGVTAASASQAKSVSLTFDRGNVFLGDDPTRAQTGPDGSFGTSFGFYLDVVKNNYWWSPFAQPYTLFSEDRLNPIDGVHSVDDGDAAQALIYRGKGQGLPLASDGIFDPTDVIVAWEDLVRAEWWYYFRCYGRSDSDFQDLVVLFERVSAAPEPCSLVVWSLLGLLGFSIGWRRAAKRPGAR